MAPTLHVTQNEHEALPTPRILAEELPCTQQQQLFLQRSRGIVQDILEGRDPRTLLIVGPCSVHDIDSVQEYGRRLKTLSNQLSTVYPVMRTYFEKPRTLHGWKGLLYDPHLDRSHDLATGLRWTRSLLLRLADLEMPCATEFLDPMTHAYFDDLVTWGCVGARTAASQPHRQMASGLQMPVGFKNSTEGCIETAINAVICARAPHTFLGINAYSGLPSIIKTRGNPFAHLILRGSQQACNFSPEKVQDTLAMMRERLVDPCVIVDCSHDNSRKDYRNQSDVFRAVISQIAGGCNEIKGLMLESHLHAGQQMLPYPPGELAYGVSLTDACIAWSETEELLLWAEESLRDTRSALVNASS